MRAVLLTGGSEIVATALFEELARAGVPLAIVALGLNSLLRDVAPDCPYVRLEWPPVEPVKTAQILGDQLRAWGASPDDPWYVLPTEDGGLRLLLEHREALAQTCRFGYARNLEMGGLDKAELFAYLEQNGCADLMPKTVSVSDVDQALQAVAELGGDCVIKPSLKPYSMDLGKLGAKAISACDYRDSSHLERALSRAWPLASDWIVQQRLATPARGEPVLWALRNSKGEVAAVAGMVKWKYPLMGGSGCWVETVEIEEFDLLEKAERMLSALDLVGLCEIEFLLDATGEFRILELNPRPWLQVGLPGVSGYPIAQELVAVLQGEAPHAAVVRTCASWVNMERMLAAAVSGQQGRRWTALVRAVREILSADTLAIYGTQLPYVRLRWFARMFGRLWR